MLRNLLFASLILLAACSVFRSSSKNRVIKQSKTVDAIRDLGTAVEAYKLVYGTYPIGKTGHLEEIEAQLEPRFLRKMSEEDGWGNEVEYYCLNPEGPYYIISLGSDKERDVGLYKTDRSPSGLGFNVIANLKEDIIFSNGIFVRYPQGVRTGAS
ncbi:type II secretion system protein GspG [bacterium]|nr:type II secretion system protein GspG [bacterium]